MVWVKKGKAYYWGQYEIEKQGSKWVVFFNPVGFDRYPIQKCKKICEAKNFSEKHHYRVA